MTQGTRRATEAVLIARLDATTQRLVVSGLSTANPNQHIGQIVSVLREAADALSRVSSSAPGDAVTVPRSFLKRLRWARPAESDDPIWDELAQWATASGNAALSVAPAEGTRAATDVLAERARQINVEGWDESHDDSEHADGQLAEAAACYAAYQQTGDPHDIAVAFLGNAPPYNTFDGWLRWPWARSWWKPRDRRRNLVRAGALILAEIERLDRAAPPPPSAASETTETK